MKNIIMTLILSLSPSFAFADCSSTFSSKEPLLSTALTNLSSFEYVHAALETVYRQNPGARFCTSAVVLGKNIYQYMRYYIQTRVLDPQGRVLHQFHFLYQDASVQAYHNVGKKPWVGLPEQDLRAFWLDLIDQANWSPSIIENTSESSIEQIAKASSNFQKNVDTFDSSSFTVASLGDLAGKQIYVASWINLPQGSVYAGYPTARAVLVAKDRKTGEVTVGENIWVTANIETPLADILERENQNLPARSEWSSHLLKISSPIVMSSLGK